ncbi:MAG: hypothetical protein COB89_05815 [Piscirickettsiaceae bacterium]|nr:MAG: hypothetical protein COB89_07330 [Piscirickettsiaceae bacterium]PCH83922.1 MAG: hypothetical protein COB89_05815 [Piscirickettsiaceae bacterium]
MGNIEIEECLFKAEKKIDLSTPLFRYLSLEGFLFLIEFGRIGFSKIETWPDSYEGSNFDFMKTLSEEKRSGKNVSDFYAGCWSLHEEPRVLYENNHEYESAVKELTEHGSAAMWETYCKNGGVRIKTTIGKLLECFESELVDCGLYHGKVYYEAASSFNKTIMTPSLIHTLLHKRVSFRYESEYRFILETNSKRDEPLITVQVGDLYDFLDEILVSPATSSNEWVARSIYHAGVDISINPRKHSSINSKNKKQFCRISRLYSFVSETIGYHGA